jgi:multidrug efflux system membrane fusion protein
MGKIGAIGLSALAALAGCGLWYAATLPAESAGPPPAPPAIPVTAGTAETQDVPVYVRGLGNVQAFNLVTVKTRVDGQVMKVLFTEGQEVKAGDPLFEIDPRPFQAALDQAEGTKQKDLAQLHGAQLDLERFGKLVGQGYQTRQSFDNQRALVEQLQGAVKSDDALIETAKLNLGYAEIRSPIDGRTGARQVDLGNFVQANQNTPLVLVAQLKPIFVSFTVPQEAFEEIRRNQAAGPLKVVAYASDDKTALSDGTLTLIDNRIDTATGTAHLKATFANADERLWPGEFVNARLIVATRKDAVTVPVQTVMQGPDGAYLYVIKPDDTVERRQVQVLANQDDLAVIGKGLTKGERVVVEGQYRLTTGAKAKIEAPQPAARHTSNAG